jgi:uncharacterized protein (TIGR03067 family)
MELRGRAMLRLALVFSGLIMVLHPVTGADPKVTDDLTALQGNWKPLQCEREGTPQMLPEQMKQVTVVFDKSEYYLYFKDKDREGKPKVLLLALLDVSLDPSTSPKSITFEFKDGPLKGQKRHGIYELAGNQLRMCYGPSERPKPGEFKAPANSGYFLETWARQK